MPIRPPREGVDPPNILSPMPSTTNQETGDISAQVPDFSREVPQGFWDPSRKLLRALRAYQKWRKRRGPHAWFLQKWAVLRYRFWAVVTASDIPINTQLGGGLLLLHPVGVVMHPTTTVGPNCLILQHVTITPNVRIGGHVDIGAGAVILRPVTIGNHARIGANAVVLTDVPEGAIAVGNPARIIVKS
jgi:serine O-acetyltransferase